MSTLLIFSIICQHNLVDEALILYYSAYVKHAALSFYFLFHYHSIANIFSLEILLQTLKLPTLADRVTGHMGYSDEHTSGKGTQRDTMFLLKCSYFSYCVEVGGMWKQLVFPRNPSTSIQSELV